MIAKEQIEECMPRIESMVNSAMSRAMSNALATDAFCKVELEREQALAYLHREALTFEQAPVGYLLLTYKGMPIGFAKNIGNRANNLYPAEWRIRKNPVEL